MQRGPRHGECQIRSAMSMRWAGPVDLGFAAGLALADSLISRIIRDGG